MTIIERMKALGFESPQVGGVHHIDAFGPVLDALEEARAQLAAEREYKEAAMVGRNQMAAENIALQKDNATLKAHIVALENELIDADFAAAWPRFSALQDKKMESWGFHRVGNRWVKGEKE